MIRQLVLRCAAAALAMMLVSGTGNAQPSLRNERIGVSARMSADAPVPSEDEDVFACKLKKGAKSAIIFGIGGAIAGALFGSSSDATRTAWIGAGIGVIGGAIIGFNEIQFTHMRELTCAERVARGL